MKKLLIIGAATVTMVLGMGVAPSNAISINACNQGTFNAFHVVGANGAGLYKIGAVCHG